MDRLEPSHVACGKGKQCSLVENALNILQEVNRITIRPSPSTPRCKLKGTESRDSKTDTCTPLFIAAKFTAVVEPILESVSRRMDEPDVAYAYNKITCTLTQE